MNNERLLAIAEALYGAGIRQRVFEPLVADRARELGDAPSRGLTLRWYAAYLAALVQCAPPALVADMRLSFVIDVLRPTLAVGAIAFALQWSFGLLPSMRVEQVWPPSFASTLPFVIIPLVARVRLLPLPRHQRLLQATTIAIVGAVMAAGVSVDSWETRAAAAFAVLLLAFGGWRAVDGWLFQTEMAREQWVRPVLVGSLIMVATWPLKLAAGVRLDQPYWPGDIVLLYLVGAAIVALALRHPEQSKT